MYVSVRVGSYLVKSDENQTSFTGREQRHGVWILAFLVAGLFDRQEPAEGLESGAASSGSNTTGASSEDDGDVAARRLLRSLCNVHGEAVDGEYDAGDGNENVEDEGDDDGGVDGSRCEFDWGAFRSVFPSTPLHAAVTAMFCEYALLVGRITRHLGDACASPMTLSEGQALAQQVQDFILCYATPILGRLRTTKVHRLLCHLLHAVKYHGNILNANTSANESRHKDAKKHYHRTNKRTDFTRQLVRHAQGTRAVLRKNAAALRTQQGREEPLRYADGYLADSEEQRRPLRRARTVHLEHHLLSSLAARPGLSSLPGVIGLRCGDRVAVPKHVFFQARLGDGRRLRQVVRASEAFHGSKWYDYVAYRASGTESEYGHVRLLVRLDGGVDVAVVAELERVTAAVECPLSARGCTRLRWTTATAGAGASASRHVRLRAVPVSDIIRVVHIVPDSAELCRRLGLGPSPPSFGANGQNVWDMRYLLNAFLPDAEQ